MTERPHYSRWRKSSYSGHANSDCVEARASGRGIVQVRDSKDPQGRALAFSRAAWRAFLAEVKTGNG